MDTSISFILESVLLGIGLAMDAFSVSVANGLSHPKISFGKACGMAGCYGVFQCLMPLLGWTLVHVALEYFTILEGLIPYIALLLLGYLGFRMIQEGVQERKEKDQEEAASPKDLTFGTLILQGVATSIDALSVGVVIADRSFSEAAMTSGIIGVVTFFLCGIGVFLGKKVGAKLKGIAPIIGGVILVLIGINILITHLF